MLNEEFFLQLFGEYENYGGMNKAESNNKKFPQLLMSDDFRCQKKLFIPSYLSVANFHVFFFGTIEFNNIKFKMGTRKFINSI